MVDAIADGLTRIRNASRARHASVDLRASKPVERILVLLKQEGFIRAYRAMGERPGQKVLRMTLVEQMALWDMPFLFFLMLTLMGTEWGFRRLRGLV